MARAKRGFGDSYRRRHTVVMAKVVAAVIPAPNQDVELREFDEPELEANSALLQVELSEVCGTDVYLQQGRLEGVPYPLIPGHVSVGKLAKIRGEVRDVEGNRLSEGELVTFLDVHRTCNACWHCLVAKASTRCPDRSQELRPVMNKLKVHGLGNNRGRRVRNRHAQRPVGPVVLLIGICFRASPPQSPLARGWRGFN